MSAKLRVLVISREPWRDDSNEGSVLTSLFAGQPFTLANLYCKPGLPDNRVCERYFQLTDRMALENILHKTPMGKAFTHTPESAQAEAAPAIEAEKKGFYDFFRRHQWEIFFTARQALWGLADFRSEALRRFVLDFQPDVIFAPLCYDRHILAIQRYVVDLAGCPAATYLYDDIYSFRQFRFSPLFWLNRLALRRALDKTIEKYSILYTLSSEQAEAYSAMLGRETRVLAKAAPWPDMPAHGAAHTPMRIVYAGGVYYGREKLLMLVADACRQAGCRLDVYTNSPLGKRARAKLNDGKTAAVHAAIPSGALREAYCNSDVALYVDAFDRKNRCITRLSFSSKIVDCLSSGCAVLAVCSPEHAGLRYLARMDAAICVDDPAHIPAAINALAADPALLAAYAKRALDCARTQHDPAVIRQRLRDDFTALAAAEREPLSGRCAASSPQGGAKG